MTKILLITILWISYGIGAAGLLNADFRCSFPSLYKDKDWAAQHQRINLSFGVITGPFGFVVVGVMSGFGYYGWTLSGEPLKEGECK